MPGKHFLIIDLDDSSLSRIENNILEPAGHTITTTKRADKVPTGVFDLILLGDFSGGDLLDRIELLQQAHPATPIVILTQRNRTGKLSLQALQLGAIACLSVPIQVDEIMPAISHGLARRRQLETWADRHAPGDRSDDLSQLRTVEKAARIGRSVVSILDPDQVLAAVVRAAVEIAGAEEGSVIMVTRDGGEMLIRAAYQFEQDAAQNLSLPVEDPLARQVIESGEPVFLGDGAPEEIRTRFPVRSLVYVPLISKDRVIGVLGVDNREKHGTVFTRDQIAALSVLADFAVVAIENARLFGLVEAERKKVEGIVATIADGVIVLDEAGLVVLINDRAREIFGLGAEDHTGSPVAAVLGLPDLAAAIADPKQTGLRRFELEPEERHHYIVHVNPLPGYGKTVTIQDVTHFKELDAVKNEFVTAVSHDLRSPLTAILGYVELIGRVGETSRQQREFMTRIQTSVTHITDLINALLELGRIEADFDHHKELLPLPIILRYALDGTRHLFEEKGQSIDMEVETDIPSVFGSAIRLRQMVGNLLENANKYAPPGSRITIRARGEGDQVILEVCDEGIGIPESDLPFVFNKLYRGSNVPMDSLGTGLGLSIVRSIVANHGGRLWCESKVGTGTTMTVVLPAVHS